MKIVTTVFVLLLTAMPQFSLALGYKVQIYNGSDQTINVIARHAPISKPNLFNQCKWANTNYNLSNSDNWSTPTTCSLLTDHTAYLIEAEQLSLKTQTAPPGVIGRSLLSMVTLRRSTCVI